MYESFGAALLRSSLAPCTHTDRNSGTRCAYCNTI